MACLLARRSESTVELDFITAIFRVDYRAGYSCRIGLEVSGEKKFGGFEVSIWGIVWLSWVALLGLGVMAAIAGAIAHKAGFCRWYGLLILIPVINVIALYIFAFIRWPAAEEV